ncbi:outer membrane beta-barrel protein [Mucilaginibacter psychrotolerans]|uniref:Outer membrane protein beta-barrel domain-containing protein n=1 Tax=Mucilaginibacter psychrotolerans TaxID=1524096 RepID=A0A4Y8S931_9SPHI|nr:outer membrane beta-barrel protein [Mucilaginibacter psychrotolerans]TFF35422.1 hypothetical protein E2R66_19395 [Mucilaginibacter psychrotolerans]
MITIFPISANLKMIFSLSFFLVSTICSAQNRVTIKGRVLDSLNRSPLELSTVTMTLATDSSLLSYTVADKAGAFSLTNIPIKTQLRLIISFTGHRTLTKQLEFDRASTVNVGNLLLEGGNTLNEVQILGYSPPIIVRHDTVEFNTKYFKTRPNAVVEELLKKLPGIQVDVDGTIYVNGKLVKKILLEGKEFFGSNPKVPSRNLDADIIEKVLVYDDREKDPNHLVSEALVDKIIDLRIKKIFKKGVFGKVTAGAGTKDRYQLSGLANIFRDTLQVSLLGSSNNMNTSSFNFNDLYSIGGFERGGSTSSVALGGDRFNSIQKVTSAGFNLNNDFGDKLKLNLTYYYNNSRDVYKTNALQQQLLRDSILYTQSAEDRVESLWQHNINGLLKWRPNSKTEVRYEPLLTIEESKRDGSTKGKMFSGFTPVLNNNSNNTNEAIKNITFQHSLYYFKALKSPGHSLTINHFLSLGSTSNDYFSYYDLSSFIKTDSSITIDRFSRSKNQYARLSVDATYRFPISKKAVMDVSLSSKYNGVENNLQTYDKNEGSDSYDILLPSQSSDLNRIQWTNTVKPRITYGINETWSIITAFSIQSQSLNTSFSDAAPSRLTQQYVYFLPSVELRGDGLTLSYNAAPNFPSVNQLRPVTLTYSPLYQSTGNPSLNPYISHDISSRYYKNVRSKSISISANLTLSLPYNAIVRSQSVATDGKTSVIPINVSGFNGYNLSMGTSLSKRYKRVKNLQVALSTSLNSSINRDLFIVNDKGFANTYFLKIREAVSLNWKEILEYTPTYSFSKNFASYKPSTYPSNGSTTHNLINRVDYYATKKISLQGSYTYIHNANYYSAFSNDINLVDLSISFQIQKNKAGNLRLSAIDLLNQNVSVLRYAFDNKIIESENKLLGRYFLIAYSYKFKK